MTSATSVAWTRPETEAAARVLMLRAERVQRYEEAALAALTLADFVGVRTTEGAAVLTQQALVYATLHQADTALFLSEHRSPGAARSV